MKAFPLGRTDVLLVMSGPDTGPNALAASPPVSSPIPLGDDLCVTRLGGNLAPRIIAACEPHGEFPEPRNKSLKQAYGVRNNHQLYSFVRHPAPAPEHVWDPDKVIWRALHLSRFVRPNPSDTTYAARIIHDPPTTTIVPLPEDHGSRFSAYSFDPQVNVHWLTGPDASHLRFLIYHYKTATPLPERVSQAVWWMEQAARVREPNRRWPFVGFAVESLLKTDRYGITAQVVSRLPALAADVGCRDLTNAIAREFYDARSNLVHGNRRALEKNPPNAADMNLVEETVRRAVRRAICDGTFRRHFDSDMTVQCRWP